MKRVVRLAVLALASGAAIWATPCGTVAVPTACSVQTFGPGGSSTIYTATSFSFLNSSNGGGGNLYTGADIGIDIASGGGLLGLLTFSKNPAGPTSGVVFFVNPGESSSFIFSYVLTITPGAPGTVSYLSTTTILNETHTQNALAAVQQVISPTNCQAFTGTTSVTCPPMPASVR